MPKPSPEVMHPDAATEGSGGGALAGKFEILGAVYAVIKDHKEYEPKPGQAPQAQRANPSVVALVMKATPLTDEGERLEDGETRDIILKLGGKSLATFHPGKGDGPDDTDPEDLGDELGTEGNTLFIGPDTPVEMNSKSGYTVFMKSLQHKGFPADKIAECWAANFKGLKIHVETVSADKLDAYGQKKGDAGSGERPITYKVVQAVISLPGAKKKKGQAVAETPAAPAKKTKTAAPAPPPPPPSDDDDDDSDDDAPTSSGAATAETEAVRVLQSVFTKVSGKTKSLDQVKTFWITFASDPKIKLSPKLMPESKKLASDDKWLIKNLKALGATVDKEARTATFVIPAPADDDDDDED